MPRRPAPTPLRLATGPTPPRNAPRHSMPIPPQPTFYPSAPVALASNAVPTTSTESPSSASSGDSPEAPVTAIPTVPQAQNINTAVAGPIHSYTSSLIVVPEFTGRSKNVVKSNSGRGLGPWDRSKDLKLSGEEIDAMVPCPKPTLAAPSVPVQGNGR